MVINAIIHSCEEIDDDDILNGKPLPQNNSKEYFEMGYLDKICQFIRVTCDEQYINNHDYIRGMEEFGQRIFTEDEVASLLLPFIESNLLEARKRFRPFREEPQLKAKSIVPKARRIKND